MLPHAPSANVDELLDHASDAVARNDWKLARTLADVVLRQAPGHPEAELVLRSANAYLDSDHTIDPFSGSRDLQFMSIMFCDVVGSTRLARELGDVQWRETLERFRRRCARAVRRYDGYIHEASGDELLILFGYPRVREDDARRAVLAGLDIIEAIRAFSTLLERERGCSFHGRVGIHTGRALIRERARGAPMVSDAPIGGGLVGEAAHIAKRIETLAMPDTVWVSGATRRIVEGFFEFADAPDGQRQVQLAARPVATAYRVNGPTAALNRHQIARVRSDQMIGRVAERERLLGLWEQAKQAGAPLVVVSGPAGIGKSRLVEFLAETAAGSRANRLECICTEIRQPTAFAPVIGLIERFANIRQADPADTRLTKLEGAFRALAPSFEGFVSYLAWMMSIPQPGSDVQRLEPEAVRNEIFEILLKLLTMIASIRPSVFWIEDIQWADHSTRAFCRRLNTHGPIPGLIVIVTMRTGIDAHAELPWSDHEPEAGRLVRIKLERLSQGESRQLVASRAGRLLDEGLAAAILERTGGVPLYIEEIVRSVVAGGGTRAEADSPADPAMAIPESLQPIFAQIVDRLGADRHIAQMASLLGRDLPEPLTRIVIARNLRLTEEQVVAGLARLIDVEIIEPILTELSPGYRFRHDLIREALAHSVGSDAKENHGRIAAIIKQTFPEVSHERPALLAYHFAKAERHEDAAAYWLKAGVSFQAKAAHQEAIESFNQGLESIANIREPTDATARLEMLLCAGRGVSVQTIRGYTDTMAGRDWSRAHEVSMAIGATGEAVPALAGLWSFYFVRGAHTFIRDLGTTSVKVAEQIIDASAEDPETHVIGFTCLAYSQYYGGSLSAGRASAERSWHLREQIKDRPPNIHIPQDPALAALSLLAPVRWSLGDQLGAREAIDRAMALASALESKRAINLVRVGLDHTWLHHMRRDNEQARRAAEQALALAVEFRVDWAVVNLSIHRALALAHLAGHEDDRRQALAIAEQNLGYWRGAGAETMVPYFLGEMADVHRLVGDGEAALRVASEAIELGRENGEHFHDAELHRIRGQARLACGAQERARGRDDLLRAVAIAREQHAVSFEIRSLVALLTHLSEPHGDRSWLTQLETALGALQSSEAGVDEHEARVLIASGGRAQAHA